MSLFSTLYTGVSGMQSNGTGIEIASDNISNVNTVGFKRSRANFGDIMADAMGRRLSGSVGNGSRVISIQRLFEQGALIGSGSDMDLSISGDGWFVFNGDIIGAQGQQVYSRAGQLTADKDGFITNQQGLRMRGKILDAVGNLTTQDGDLRLTRENLPPKESGIISMQMNLDSRVPRRDGAPGSPPAFDTASPETTSDFTASITIHDSLGVPYEAQVYFERQADVGGNAVWGVHVMVKPDVGPAVRIARDLIAFNADGALAQHTPGPASWNPNPPATQGVVIAFNPGQVLGPTSTGLDGATCFGSASTMLTQTQDGYSTGDLVAVEVAPDGVLRGRYTNGRSFVAGQVVLAKFPTNEGLRRIGDNLFAETLTSGDAALGQPNTGGRGYISQRSLEQSNVDLAQEFVDLIRFQRAFQANSRSVSTSDDMLNEVVNLKR